MMQVDSVSEKYIWLHKECIFAVLWQGGMVSVKSECKRPEYTYWCSEIPRTIHEIALDWLEVGALLAFIVHVF